MSDIIRIIFNRCSTAHVINTDIKSSAYDDTHERLGFTSFTRSEEVM